MCARAASTRPHLHDVGPVQAVDAVDAEGARLALRLNRRRRAARRGASAVRGLQVEAIRVGIGLDLVPQQRQPAFPNRGDIRIGGPQGVARLQVPWTSGRRGVARARSQGTCRGLGTAWNPSQAAAPTGGSWSRRTPCGSQRRCSAAPGSWCAHTCRVMVVNQHWHVADGCGSTHLLWHVSGGQEPARISPHRSVCKRLNVTALAASPRRLLGERRLQRALAAVLVDQVDAGHGLGGWGVGSGEWRGGTLLRVMLCWDT